LATDPEDDVNPELQILVERVEALERQSRSARGIAVIAVLIAIATLAATLAMPRGRSLVPATTGRFDVIEANRILLRDPDSRPAGGMEVDRNGTIRLVLGRAGTTGGVLLEAQQNGVAHLTLKGPDGTPLAALVGSRRSELTLGNRQGGPSVAIGTRDDGAGTLSAWDAQGKIRFRAP
jgi:hypothetical protein